MGGRTLSGGLENAYVLLKFCVKVAERLGRKKRGKRGVGQVKSAHSCIRKEKPGKEGKLRGEKALKLKM